jgi:nucleoside-diphosphate-sugar epimerase
MAKFVHIAHDPGLDCSGPLHTWTYAVCVVGKAEDLRAQDKGRRPEDGAQLHPASPLRRPLTVYGEGSQSRSVQYVDDLIECVLRLMKSPEDRPVNIGNPVENSVRQVAQMILEISGSRSGIVYEPLPEDAPKQRRQDITRARETLGWEPGVPAKEGLKLTFGWFAQRLSPSEAAPLAGQ